jgi:hypothetical protein
VALCKGIVIVEGVMNCIILKCYFTECAQEIKKAEFRPSQLKFNTKQ